MYVYRVEHPDSGLGPFRHAPCEDPMDVAGHAIRRCLPVPQDDGIHIPEDDWVCGLPHEDVIRVWFPMLDDLIRYGYVLRRYRINKRRVRAGKSGLQVIFKPRDASTVATLRAA